MALRIRHCQGHHGSHGYVTVETERIQRTKKEIISPEERVRVGEALLVFQFSNEFNNTDNNAGVEV